METLVYSLPEIVDLSGFPENHATKSAKVKSSVYESTESDQRSARTWLP
jgi:hypothetical protein